MLFSHANLTGFCASKEVENNINTDVSATVDDVDDVDYDDFS